VAAQHQAYIERDGACVASFGNIAQAYEERTRVWQALGDRLVSRGGWVEIGVEAPHVLRAAVVGEIESLREAGCVTWERARALRCRYGPGVGAEEPVRLRARDRREFDSLCRWVRDRAPERGDGKFPDGVRVRKPREKVVQRRLIAELAHELPVETQREVLERWCEAELGRKGWSYHAVIHQPERGNDARNFHAHVVMATVSLERARDARGQDLGRFAFETRRGVPRVVEPARVLGGNGEGGARGGSEMVMGWRDSFARVQNEALARLGVDKRYDPRSRVERGLPASQEVHWGPARAALLRRARSVGVESEAGPWEGLEGEVVTWAGKQGGVEEVNAAVCALQRLRLLGGLAEAGHGPGTVVYEHLDAGFAGQVWGEVSDGFDAVRETVYGQSAKEWGRRWRAVSEGFGVPAQRALQASRLVADFGGQGHVQRVVAGLEEREGWVEGLRAMVVEAGAFDAFRRRLRERVDVPEGEDARSRVRAQDEAESVRRTLSRFGLDARWVLGRDLERWMMERAGRARRRVAARVDLRRRAAMEVARAESPGRARAAAQRLLDYHRVYLEGECEGPERERLVGDVGAMVRAAAVRGQIGECARAAMRVGSLGGVPRVPEVDEGAGRWLGRRGHALLAAVRVQDEALDAMAREAKAGLALTQVALGKDEGRSLRALGRLSREPGMLGVLQEVYPGVGVKLHGALQDWKARRRRLGREVVRWERSLSGEGNGAGAANALLLRDPVLLGIEFPQAARAAERQVDWWVEQVRETAQSNWKGEEAREDALVESVRGGAVALLMERDAQLGREVVKVKARRRRRRRQARREGLVLTRGLGRAEAGSAQRAALEALGKERLADRAWCAALGEVRTGKLRLLVEASGELLAKRDIRRGARAAR